MVLLLSFFSQNGRPEANSGDNEQPRFEVVKASDTCWLSHKAAVNAVLRCLPAMITTLQQQSETTIIGLLKVMTRYDFFHPC